MIRDEFEIEVCANSFQSAIAAEQGGANRIELSDNIRDGGTTPSTGLLSLLKEKIQIDIFPIIRPRSGDFLYNKDEFELMRRDIEILHNYGADGFVIGCLALNGGIDYDKCAALIEASRGLPITFHRAFDMGDDPFRNIEILKRLGVKRLLTSGQKPKAVEGIELLKELVQQAGDHLLIMPGGGVDEANIIRIAMESGARQFHISLREPKQSPMIFRREEIKMGDALSEEYSIRISSAERIKKCIQLLLGTEIHSSL